MFVICKTFKFEAAHILSSSYSKCCQNLHGHSYKLQVFIKSKKLNEDGMVIDFGELKDRLVGFLGGIDHTFFPAKNWNPTAENMAEKFFFRIKELIRSKKGIKLEKVRVHETETGWAEYYE